MRTARFGWFLVAELALFAGCISQKRIPLGMRPHFERFLLSRSASAIPLQIRGTCNGSASDSILRGDRQRHP